MGVVVCFVNHLDPNNHGMDGVSHTPDYDFRSGEVIHFFEGTVDIMEDACRQQEMEYTNEIGGSSDLRK